MKRERDDRARPCEGCQKPMPLLRTMRLCAVCIAARLVMEYRERTQRAMAAFERAVKTQERFAARCRLPVSTPP
jgi:hypothetical protein